MSTQEIAQLGAQLPPFIRGIFYEGWNPAKTPITKGGKPLFLRQVRGEFAHTSNPEVDAEHITRAVLRVLCKHVSKGELEQVKALFPRALRELWPQSKAA
jgi:uncharacterized protein (DUF2267 family)